MSLFRFADAGYNISPVSSSPYRESAYQGQRLDLLPGAQVGLESFKRSSELWVDLLERGNVSLDRHVQDELEKDRVEVNVDNSRVQEGSADENPECLVPVQSRSTAGQYVVYC